MRLYALDSVDIEPLRDDLMARLEHHRDRCARYERILNKRFPRRNRSPADTGKLLGPRIGLRHEREVAEWCEEAIDALSALVSGIGVNVEPRDVDRWTRLRARQGKRCRKSAGHSGAPTVTLRPRRPIP